jgi:plasmid stabilization system protein ParE
MARFVLSDPAKQDVRDIVAYIRKGSPEAAIRVRRELRAAMQNLATFPYMGHRRDDLTTEPLRFWCVYSYLIAYRPDTTPLQVIRVVHGARDLGRIFGNP